MWLGGSSSTASPVCLCIPLVTLIHGFQAPCVFDFQERSMVSFHIELPIVSSCSIDRLPIALPIRKQTPHLAAGALLSRPGQQLCAIFLGWKSGSSSTVLTMVINLHYSPVMCYSLLLKMAIDIVDFTQLENGGSFHGYLTVYQRIIHGHNLSTGSWHDRFPRNISPWQKTQTQGSHR